MVTRTRVDQLYACPICHSTKWIWKEVTLPVICDASKFPHAVVLKDKVEGKFRVVNLE